MNVTAYPYGDPKLSGGLAFFSVFFEDLIAELATFLVKLYTR